jgi:hypothetical protein
MLLKETIVYILTEIYRINAPNIDIAWEELSRSEQLDMQIAQRLIMKHVPLHLRGIGVQKDPLLRREFELWDEARYGMEEFSDNQKKYSEYEGKEKQAIKQIKKLIISEPNVQETILEAIRKKITDFQYSSERIPFEIFQNADDAIAELAFICESTTSQKSSQLSSSAQRFVLRKSDSKITFMHWGRPINHVGSAKFNGRQYGYHQDLEKMLLWSSSDKQSGTDVTGKFGLGFKSIFLASNTPCVVSGRLGFKIVAGLYPDKLDSPSRIRKQLDEETGDERLPGTIIELCLDRPGLNNVCDTFICMAGVLTVFSKKIRKIEVFSNNNKISYEWFGDVVFQPPDSTLEIGTINTFNTTTSKIQNFKGLHFKFNKGGGFLVGVGQRGLTQLPDDLPAIWVVAPTRESIGLGFAVNGNFAVDAGRTRLSGTSQANDVEGKRLGDQLGGCLLTMFEEADREWPLFRKRMHLDVDLEPYEFWNSVWGVMTNGLIGGFDSAVSGIIRNILTEDNGLGRLVKECSALPTGLWTDDYRVLTKTGHVRFVLRGALSQQRVFEKVSRLEIFADNVSPGSAVANNIHDALCKVSPSYARKRDQWQSLTLGQVLLWMENSDFRVSPETAEVLGQIITLELLENLRGTDGGINEAAHLKEVLKRIKFKTRSGNWYSCRNNLVSDSPVKGVGEDELLRAAFAPDDNILDQSYSETGVMFFATCREKLNATAELMNDWIIQAESIPIQRAALTYLLVGELGERLAELIRRRGLHGTWLANLRSSGSIFEGWDQDDINEVLIRRLCSIDKIGVISGGNEGEDLKLDATETLNSISRWWREQGPEEIKKYDSQTYPGGEIPDLHEDYFGRINRNNWLVVFVLGACHTFGLTRRQQHKGFIELCRQKGWWDTFSAEAPETRADQWMSVLDQYIDAQVDVSEYEMWMNRFPAIYRLARDLDAYSEIFLDIGRNSELANLDEITITRANSKYQGGSYSTPPLKRTLGIGACFVVRELKRAGRITSKVATPHCYLPVARIRRLMNLMGCPDLDSNQAYAGQSKIIHRFICEHLGEKEAQFQGAYDIPLQIVMERSDLQRQLIGRVVDQE